MLVNIICLVVGVAGGLLIGMKNPTVAAAAAKMVAAGEAKAAAAIAAAKLKIQGK